MDLKSRLTHTKCALWMTHKHWIETRGAVVSKHRRCDCERLRQPTPFVGFANLTATLSAGSFYDRQCGGFIHWPPAHPTFKLCGGCIFLKFMLLTKNWSMSEEYSNTSLYVWWTGSRFTEWVISTSSLLHEWARSTVPNFVVISPTIVEYWWLFWGWCSIGDCIGVDGEVYWDVIHECERWSSKSFYKLFFW